MTWLSTCAAALLTWVATAAEPELLWDNALSVDRMSNGHAISPPIFPLIRQADDLVVADESWIVTDLAFGVIEDAGWLRGETLQVFVYADNGQDFPGPLRRSLATDYAAEFQNRQGFDRDVYHYWVSDPGLALDAGRHWIGPRNPEGAGQGTNYWLECSFADFDCGDDPRDTFPNCSSLDEGETWNCHGSSYHFHFQLHGFRALDAAPFSFEVTRGQRVGGGLLSLAEDDDARMRIAARRPSEVSQPSVEIVLEGISPVDFQDATAIAFTLDARATAAAIERVELYDWVAQRFVRVHAEPAALGADRTTDVVVRDDVADFITPATSRMRARVSYYDPGIPIAGWFAEVDQAIWRVGRPAP